MNNNDEIIHSAVSLATLDDVEAMVKLEACWNYRQLPPNALSETGALYIPLGTTGLARVLSDRNSRILIVKRTGRLQGMVVACGKSLALQMWPGLAKDYAPADSTWQEPFMYVKTIAVDPSCAGSGLGKTLLMSLRELAIEMNQKSILAGIAIDPPNKRSLALFTKSLGAREMGRHYDEEKGILWGLFRGSLES